MKLKAVFLIVFASMITGVAVAKEDAKNKIVIEQTEESSVFKGVFYKVWSNLRKLSPKQQATNNYRVIATAGIRGSESTETVLAPYWKGDLHEDVDLSKMVDSYKRSQTMIEKGELEGASKELASFFSNYPDSYLRPNALFAQGLVTAALGDKNTSGDSLQKFIKDYPQHPMVEDAKTILGEIGLSIN